MLVFSSDLQPHFFLFYIYTMLSKANQLDMKGFLSFVQKSCVCALHQVLYGVYLRTT